MRSLFFLLAGLASLAGCSLTPVNGGYYEIVFIEAPRFCQGEVRAYSDFAYIRPAQETIIGNTCDDVDPLGDGPVLWFAAPGYDGWQPPPDREERRAVDQKFRRGAVTLPTSVDALTRLLDLAAANPQQAVRVIGHSAKGERSNAAEKRAQAVRAWLIKHGLSADRIVVGHAGDEGSKVTAEITIVVKG